MKSTAFSKAYMCSQAYAQAPPRLPITHSYLSAQGSKQPYLHMCTASDRQIWNPVTIGIALLAQTYLIQKNSKEKHLSIRAR